MKNIDDDCNQNYGPNFFLSSHFDFYKHGSKLFISENSDFSDAKSEDFYNFFW